jgi:hypothetical protein
VIVDKRAVKNIQDVERNILPCLPIYRPKQEETKKDKKGKNKMFKYINDGAKSQFQEMGTLAFFIDSHSAALVDAHSRWKLLRGWNVPTTFQGTENCANAQCANQNVHIWNNMNALERRFHFFLIWERATILFYLI